MKFRGEWGTICAQSVRTEDEVVLLCKLLGYSGIDPDAAILQHLTLDLEIFQEDGFIQKTVMNKHGD